MTTISASTIYRDRHKWSFSAGVLSFAFAAIAVPLAAQHLTVVKPQESFAVLANPGIGFTTFQRFNGDLLNPGTSWTEGMPINYQPTAKSMVRSDYPLSSIAYFRVYWRFLEPARDEYRWEIVDKALVTARQHHQTLMLRIAPYGTDEVSDVPAWYRKETGQVLSKDRPKANWASTTAKWMVYPENPAYAKEFGGFVRKLGERYDGNPELEAVDISIVAAWGEGAGSHLLTERTRRQLVDSYMESFRKTPLLVQPSDAKTVAYTLSKASNGPHPKPRGPVVGWRADCLGDMGGFSPTYNMMTDVYPEAVIEYGLNEVWRTAPVSMEACWVMQHWKDKGWDLQYIMDQAIKWHVSSFNAKSSAVPPEWWPQVNQWLNRMGYRFVLRRFAFTALIDSTRRLTYTSWWENKGDAPAYRDYKVALRISQKDKQIILPLDGDPRQWMPGDSLVNGAVYLPQSLSDGRYNIEVALIDPVTLVPKIQLAIQGTAPDGWYPLGSADLETSGHR